MKYQLSILINKPLETVVAKFENPAHYPKWMAGLIKHELLKGKACQKGAQSSFIFQMGKRRIEMVETVILNELPKAYDVQYVAKGVFNLVQNRFEAVDEVHTRQTVIQEFHFINSKMKLMAWLMPGVFKKQSKEYMKRFKQFVENED